MMKILFIVSIVYFYLTGYSQDTSLQSGSLNFSEVVVSATKSTISQNQLAQSVLSITKEKISQLMPQSTADLLQKTGSIVVQKSQQGGGSPIVRGLEANRVLLVVDGIRMNNIIYRGGHLQNIVTIDPNILERVEVLFGPASSVYGSDALGGVIHLITKRPALSSNPTFISTVNTRYSTVNDEKMIHYDGMYSGTRFGALFSATYTSYGDLNSGRNKNQFARGDSLLWQRKVFYEFENNVDVLKQNAKPWKQIASGFDQLDLAGKLFWQKDKLDHTLNLQYSTSSDIPRYDRLTDKGNAPAFLRNGDWYYGPQKRVLVSYRTNLSTQFPLTLNLNYQSIKESRHNRRAGNYNLQNRIEDVSIVGIDFFHRRNKGKRTTLVGADAQMEGVKSTAYSTNLNTGAVAPIDTRYPSGFNHMNRIGAYYIETLSMGSNFSSQGSLRLGYVTMNSDFGTNEFFKLPFNTINQNNLTYSANIGFNYNPTQYSKIGLAVATGYRVPNVDDAAKVFESVAGRLVVPNPDLKPEQSASIELNSKVSAKNLQSWLNASLYFTQLIDVISIGSFKYNGQDSVLYNNVKSAVIAYQNNSKAQIVGFSIDGQAEIAKNIHFTGTINWVRGNIFKSSGKTPLDHIPPLCGKFGLDYTTNKWKAEVNTQFNGIKKIEDYLLNAEDNEVYAMPYGMPAWMTYNVYGSFNLTQFLKVGLALENILDTEYRVFASGINAPGRNLSISLRATF